MVGIDHHYLRHATTVTQTQCKPTDKSKLPLQTALLVSYPDSFLNGFSNKFVVTYHLNLTFMDISVGQL